MTRHTPMSSRSSYRVGRTRRVHSRRHTFNIEALSLLPDPPAFLDNTERPPHRPLLDEHIRVKYLMHSPNLITRIGGDKEYDCGMDDLRKIYRHLLIKRRELTISNFQLVGRPFISRDLNMCECELTALGLPRGAADAVFRRLVKIIDKRENIDVPIILQSLQSPSCSCDLMSMEQQSTVVAMMPRRNARKDEEMAAIIPEDRYESIQPSSSEATWDSASASPWSSPIPHAAASPLRTNTETQARISEWDTEMHDTFVPPTIKQEINLEIRNETPPFSTSSYGQDFLTSSPSSFPERDIEMDTTIVQPAINPEIPPEFLTQMAPFSSSNYGQAYLSSLTSLFDFTLSSPFDFGFASPWTSNPLTGGSSDVNNQVAENMEQLSLNDPNETASGPASNSGFIEQNVLDQNMAHSPETRPNTPEQSAK